MTDERDLDREMTFAGVLDARTADRLLSGRVAPGDAPPGYASIARAVQHVMATPRPTDPAREAATLAAVVREMRSNRHLQQPVRTRSMRARVLSVKAAVIGATMVFGVTAAAAATNTLPAPVQKVVSDAASHVGVSIPKPQHHPNSSAGGTRTGTGPNASGRATYGLCSAYASRTKNAPAHDNDSVAFANLQKAAAAAGMSVVDYCKNATKAGGENSTATTAPSGETPTTHPSTSNGSVPPASTPDATTDPTTPGDTAPGHTTDKTTPGDTAPGHTTDKTTPGDTAPGKTENTDKTTPGDTAPGKIKHKP